MFERVTHLFAPALLILALALISAAPAVASGDDVVRDCADNGYIDGEYTNAEKRAALKRIPADLDAYSDCRSQIKSSMGPSAGASGPGGFPAEDGGGDGGGGGGTGGSGGGSGSGSGANDAGGASSDEGDAASGDSKRELARAETEALLGDRTMDPDTTGVFDRASTASGLPLPVLLALIALTLLLAAGAVVLGKRRNPELFAGALSRVPFPRGRGPLSFLRRR
jgi:hypothetical protein